MIEIDERHYRFLLNSVRQDNSDRFGLEFLGILKNYDLYNDKKSCSYLEYLIECKIYLEVNEVPRVFYCIDIVKEMRDENIDLNNLDAFHYNDKKYIYNFKIYQEIYKLTEYVIKERLAWDIENDSLHLISELNAYIDDDEKITFLKEKLKYYWKPNEDTSAFLLFMNQTEQWEGQTWEDEIRSYLVEDDIFHLFYLTCSKAIELKNSTYYNIDYKRWVDCYRKRKLIEFCKNEIFKINGYSNVSQKDLKSNNLKSDLIFKANGEEIFNYIDLNYEGDKNQAFYNYLYYFLKDELKIIKLEDEHSITYTSYVKEKGLLETYGRMKKAISTSRKKHNAMIALFKKMYSRKFE